HHCVYTIDPILGQWFIYIDGLLESSNVISFYTPTFGTNTPLWIGSRSGSFGFGGGLGDLRFYNRVLNQSEIAAIYN
ncbi:LamG-like jellyroll fold domain-containing protein, partial [Pseudomonas marginalis]|uniref:LamG-like jellyroll fold domain-containing protein n=1 Tax=Pseudomonas marginalis TaxID=298 RepID=UPI0034D741EF